MRFSYQQRTIGGRDGLSNRYDGHCAGVVGAGDGLLAIGIERRIGEVRVTIDEAHRCKHRRGSAAVSASVG